MQLIKFIFKYSEDLFLMIYMSNNYHENISFGFISIIIDVLKGLPPSNSTIKCFEEAQMKRVSFMD